MKKRRRRVAQVKTRVNTEWMSSDEAAEYLRMPTTRALYDLVGRSKLPAYRLGKRSLIFARSELDEYIRSNRVMPRKKRPKPS
jgi:excisionase family DNA binding protein